MAWISLPCRRDDRHRSRQDRQVHLAATVDEDGQQVTPARAIGYDTLVISIGSVTMTLEHPASPSMPCRWKPRRTRTCFKPAPIQRLRARPDASRTTPAGQLHVAIVGAGATGTELAAELHRTTQELVAYET